ncbi:helix-turn-helix domain-containing protein [Microlunatus sp. GCM10028923]|uniref:helix-turn-helix domain-containing protein n=1 Tax=Microlunatus sp. GCM10028923 TaxID=3273400 RepID=UPI003623BD4B
MTITEPATYGMACQTLWSPTMVQAHQHNDIELNYAGDPLQYLIGGRPLTLRAGQAAVFWAAQPHQLLVQGPLVRMTWATVPLAQFLTWPLAADQVRRLLDGEVIIGTRDVSALYSAGHLQQWERDLAAPDADDRELVALELRAFITRVLQSPAATPDHPGSAARSVLSQAAEMANFIALHCHEPLRVKDVADAIHVHPHHAMAIFKQALGRTINSYLTSSRIAVAQRILLTTDASVAEVGHRSGFGSLSRFYEAFTAHCDVPPSAYRRRHAAIRVPDPSPRPSS